MGPEGGSLNPWSGCMGSRVAKCLEEKGLLGIPAGLDARMQGLEAKEQ